MYSYSKRFLHALLRRNFVSFLAKAFASLNLGENFIYNWHIDLIADYLEAVRLSHIKRLIINVPPRSLKSLCINVAWTSWLLGFYPGCKIISTSYSSPLSIKHSLDTRFIIQSNWYQNLFPQTKISNVQNQKYKFLTTKNGFRLATSIGGTLTGEGGDILIVDDPHNPVHIHSTKIRNHAINWFENSFITRINNKNKAAVVIIMQRLHNQDLSGYLLGKGGWDLLKIPSVAQKDICYQINGKNYFFSKGQLLNSKLDNFQSLAQLQKEIGYNNYQAQYLQNPVQDKNNLLAENDISFYSMLPEKFSYFVLSWDTAVKTSQNADYSVCTCWGVVKNIYYLVDIIRDKMSYPVLKTIAISQIQKYMPKFVLIEDKSSGQSLIQDLLFDGYKSVCPIKTNQDKFTRFSSAIPDFQSGRILFPSKAKFKDLLIQEVTAFPDVNHDDIVDSISQFINFMRDQKFPSSSPKTILI